MAGDVEATPFTISLQYISLFIIKSLHPSVRVFFKERGLLLKDYAADRPDEEALLLIASQIADLQGQFFILKIESSLAMERVLTVEQRKKLNGKYLWQHGGHGNDRYPAVNGKFEKHR